MVVNQVSLSQALEIIDKHHGEKTLDIKCELSGKLLNYLKDPNSEQITNNVDIQKLYDIVITSLDTLSYKLIVISLDMVYPIVLRYYNNKMIQRLLESTFDKLGDSKPQIREIAYINIRTILENSPDELNATIDIIMQALKKVKASRNKFLKIHIVQILTAHFENVLTVDTVNKYSKYMIHFVELLDDINNEVKEQVAKGVLIFYGVMTEQVKNTINSKMNISSSKIRNIFPTICEELLACSAPTNTSINKHESSKIQNVLMHNNANNSKSYSVKLERKPNLKPKASILMAKSAPSSVVNEDDFDNIWEIGVFTNATTIKEVCKELNEINDIISNIDCEWDIRVKKLKNLRGITKNFIDNYDKTELIQLIKPLTHGLEMSVKDLRSQVCKEACATISYLAAKFGNHFSPLLEQLIHVFIPIFQNAIKIISSSTLSCMLLCVKYTVEPRIIIPLVNAVNNSKSKDIRKRCLQLICKILECWPQQSWYPHIDILTNVVIKGICDADSETRDIARQIFWFIAAETRPVANEIYSKLDCQRQKTILRNKPNTFIGDFGNNQVVADDKTNYRNRPLLRSASNLPYIKLPLTNRTKVLSSTNSDRFSNSNLVKKPLKSLPNDNNILPCTQTSKQLPRPLVNLSECCSSLICSCKDSSIVANEPSESIKENETAFLRQSSTIGFSAITNKKISSKVGGIVRPTTLGSLSHANTPRSAMLLSMRKQKSNLSSVVIISPLSSHHDIIEDIPNSNSNTKDIGRPGFTPYSSHSKTQRFLDESEDCNYKTPISLTANKTNNEPTQTICDNTSKNGYDTIIKYLVLKHYSSDELLSLLNNLYELMKSNTPISPSQLLVIQSCISNLLNEKLDSNCMIALLNFLSAFLSHKYENLSNWISSLLSSLFYVYDNEKNENINDILIVVIEIIRDTIDSDIQLKAIFTFITTNKILSLKTKLLILQLINVLLLMSCDSDQQIWESKEFLSVISLMTSWAMDLRDANLRKNSKLTLIGISQIDQIGFHKCISKIQTNKQKFLSNIIKTNLKSKIIDESLYIEDGRITDSKDAHGTHLSTITPLNPDNMDL